MSGKARNPRLCLSRSAAHRIGARLVPDDRAGDRRGRSGHQGACPHAPPCVRLQARQRWPRYARFRPISGIATFRIRRDTPPWRRSGSRSSSATKIWRVSTHTGDDHCRENRRDDARFCLSALLSGVGPGARARDAVRFDAPTRLGGAKKCRRIQMWPETAHNRGVGIEWVIENGRREASVVFPISAYCPAHLNIFAKARSTLRFLAVSIRERLQIPPTIGSQELNRQLKPTRKMFSDRRVLTPGKVPIGGEVLKALLQDRKGPSAAL
jgi:hypothetical protein